MSTTNTQTKADRSEAAKKAAATRERNQTRQRSSEQGRKAAATRLRNDAFDRAEDARKAASRAVTELANTGKSAGGAVAGLAKSVASRVPGQRGR